MKKLFIILLLPIVSCVHTEPTSKAPVNRPDCEIPSDLPDTLCTGEEIDWDCDWQSSYINGNVKTIKGQDGCVEMIYRNIKK